MQGANPCPHIRNAGVAELVDASDLKSGVMNRVRVRLPSPVYRRKGWWCVVQGWIPVNQLLPDVDGKYIVTIHDESIGLTYVDLMMFINDCTEFWSNVFAGLNGPQWYCSDSEYGACVEDDVIAWMPLPQPYVATNEKHEKELHTCETCASWPPSSCDGKSCTVCNPDDPLLDMWEPREVVE